MEGSTPPTPRYPRPRGERPATPPAAPATSPAPAAPKAPQAPGAPMPPWRVDRSLAHESLYAHRLARVVFGVVLLVGALGFGLAVLANIFNGVDKSTILNAFGFDSHPGVRDRTGYGQTLLAGTWLAAGLAWALTRLTLPRLLRRRWRAGWGAAGGERGPVGFFEGAPRSLHALEGWALPSLTLPLIGISLLMPLSLHGLLFAFFHHDYGMDFDRWAGTSFLLVGHVHLALAWHATRNAKRLLHPNPTRKARAGITLLWVCLLSVFPGGFFYLVPPVITLFTGAAFIPLMYLGARRVAQQDRALLQAAV